jgi:hypothetical protein
MVRHVVLVGTDVRAERIASIITVKRITEVGKTLAKTGSLIPFTLIMEMTRSPKSRFSQKPQCVTSQKTAFFVKIT